MKKVGFLIFLLLIVISVASACNSAKIKDSDSNYNNEAAVQAASAYHADLDAYVTLGMNKTDVIHLLGAPFNRLSENRNEVFFYKDGGEDSPGSYLVFIQDVLVKISLQGPKFETVDGYRCGMDASEIGDDWTLEDDSYYDVIAIRYYDANGNLVKRVEEAALEQMLFVLKENKIGSISIAKVN